MSRALLVSWLFPPHGSIGAKRAYRFARYLPAHGWDVTVLCGREPPNDLRDDSPWPLPSEVRVVKDYDPAWLTVLANRLDARMRRLGARRTVSVASGSMVRSRTARIVSFLGQWMRDAWPTETVVAHVPHAIRVARKIADTERPDVVWTTSYPYSAHLVGVALARSHGIPWVADLRDPWTLNFVHERKLALARALERRLEALVFAVADRVVVTTESLAEAYRKLYPFHADKFVVIRNAFDPFPLPPRCPARRPTLLVHFGHVYAARTLKDVFDALAMLRERGMLRPGDLVLENYGRLSDMDRAHVERRCLTDFVRVFDTVPYAHGIARLRHAHLALLPAWGTERGALFLPGKLYDYLLAGAPILAVGNNPELGAILSRTRSGVLHPPGDVSGIAATIAAAMDGTFVHNPDAEAVWQYAAPHAAARLAFLFEQVTSEARVRSASAPVFGDRTR